MTWRCSKEKKKKTNAVNYLHYLQALRGDSIFSFVVLTSDSAVYLRICLSLCVSAFMSLCIGLSLQACHLWTCLSPPFLSSFYTVCPHDSHYADSIPYCLLSLSRPAFSDCCLSSPFPRRRPHLDDFLYLRLAVCIFPPSSNSTEPAVVSHQNNIFKNAVNITPTNSEGLLVGYSCIQVYIVSWWRCTGGEPNTAIPSNFDVFIHSH